MNYNQLIQSYKLKRTISTKYGQVKEDKTYNLYKIIINNNSKKTLLITTGFHGEEFNAPISLLNIIKEIIEYSKKKKVNLIIYPCINPSGFELKKRYNHSNEKGNNDFVRYKINNQWKDSIKTIKKPIRFKLINPKAKESNLLKKDILKNIIPAGFIDIHQDDDLKKGDFYVYIANNKRLYNKIMGRISRIAKRCRNQTTTSVDENGNLNYTDKIDSNGLVLIPYSHSAMDLFHILGSEFSITAETNVKTPLKKVEQINKIWICSMMDLISKSKKTDLKILNKAKLLKG